MHAYKSYTAFLAQNNGVFLPQNHQKLPNVKKKVSVENTNPFSPSVRGGGAGCIQFDINLCPILGKISADVDKERYISFLGDVNVLFRFSWQIRGHP